MPIGTDRQGGLNTQNIAAIGEGNVTPAVGDLMKAFRDGFITVDDFTRRGLSLPVEAEAQKQNLADLKEIRPLARQQQTGALSNEIQIQPRKQALAMGATEAAIRALPTEAESAAADAARAKAAQITTGLSSPDANVRLSTVAQLSTDQVLDTWTSIHGAAPPDQIEIPGAGGVSEPQPIDEWYLENVGEHPAGTRPFDNINRPEVQAAYQQYVTEAKSRPAVVFKGTPEYFGALKADVADIARKQAIEAAGIKALPGIYEARSKAAAEGPAKLESIVSGANKDYGVKKEIHDLRQVQASYYKLQSALDPNNKNPSPAEDQAAIFSWMKILDPGSTVRDSEYATAENARGVPDTVRNFWNKFKSGKILTAEQRVQFLAASEGIYAGQARSAIPTIEQFIETEARIGAPPNSIVPRQDVELLNLVNRTTKPAASAKAPAGSGGTAQTGLPSTPGAFQVGDFAMWNGQRVRIKAITPEGAITEPAP